MSAEAGDINWYIGTICIEVKLHPRHISNYAMVCMKYTDDQNNKTDIMINFGREYLSYKSQVLPFNKAVCVGLDKDFAVDYWYDEGVKTKKVFQKILDKQ